MPIKNKHTSKKPLNISKLFRIFYHSAVMVSLALLIVTVVAQTQVIQSLAEQDFKAVLATVEEGKFEPMTIDVDNQLAYVPQSNLQFKYTNYASGVLYQLISGEDQTAKNDVSISFVEKYQLVDSRYSNNTTCSEPYLLRIGENIPEGYSPASTKQLNDGRSITIAASSSKDCKGYIGSTSGAELLSLLNSVQSY